MCKDFCTVYFYYTSDDKLTSTRVGGLYRTRAQVVEHRTGNAKDVGLILVEAWVFFRVPLQL